MREKCERLSTGERAPHELLVGCKYEAAELRSCNWTVVCMCCCDEEHGQGGGIMRAARYGARRVEC